MSEQVTPGSFLTLKRRLLDILCSSVQSAIESLMTTHVNDNARYNDNAR